MRDAGIGIQVGGQFRYLFEKSSGEADVEFLEEPRSEVYGKVVVFRDIAGNKWDLLGS